MSEEVTYADLYFQDSGKAEKIQELDRLETKVPAAPSHLWVKTALGLTLFFLLLFFIGLGILGSVIYKLKHAQEGLQRNVSLQQMDNLNSSEKIQSLSIAMQTLATRLCRELQKSNPEHKCKPCSRDWIWNTNKCYFVYHNYNTWKNSEKFCADKNANLLKINNKSTLEFVKTQWYSNYWLGMSPMKNNNLYMTLEQSLTSSIWHKSNLSDINKMYCGYSDGTYIYSSPCTDKRYVICEKIAEPVQVESVLG